VTIQPSSKGQRFQLILLKPSHYDDDGYVIRWWRAMIPSNSLAALYGIAADSAQRQVLGPGVSIDIEGIDEMNTRNDISRLIVRMREHKGLAWSHWLVCSRTSTRARWISHARSARPISRSRLAASMSRAAYRCWMAQPLSSMPDAKWASRCSQVKPRAVLRRGHRANEPILPARYVQRTLGRAHQLRRRVRLPVPVLCTIINVQGRKSRSRSPDDVERLVRANWEQGIHKFFITDDNFARNKDWEAIFDRLIELREQHGIPLGLLIQVDTLCHRIPNFVERRSVPVSRACSSDWRTLAPTT
jgi:hypothetical protein